jgi:membrane fusion protein (multidrug efflux system)
MNEQPAPVGAQPPGSPTRDTQQPPSDASREPAPRRRRRGVVIPILLLVLVAVASGVYWYVKIRGVISTDDAYIDGDRVSVSTKMLGRIVELGADEGDTVREGELLARLDDADLRAQEGQAQASLAHARENLQVSAVEVEGLQRDFERMENQLGSGGITQQQYDHAKTALDLGEARQRVALAQVQTARAQLQVVDTQIQNTIINAPFSGVVARRWVVAGDVVQPGQPIFAIYDLADLWVTANFEETKIARIHPGDRVTISLDAYPDRELTGTLLWIGAATASQFSLIPPNNASGNFTKVTQRVPVRISIDRPELGTQDPLVLVPGLSVEVSIKVREQ